ncbi:MAG TPA: PAS domain-containing protein [Sphingomicrobium sp.]|nr:PAS domain-containing protein [Sphingomicrobium sp.]
MLAQRDPEHYLDTAVTALSGGGDYRSVLDALPVPIYVTDPSGAVTYWNRACVAFAGREPQLGKDKWCVTWKIFTTTGDFLPHDQCPMAQAIRNQRMVRDAVAIAERPDGSRRAFRPYPTPLFDDSGTLTGAINMLIDVTDEQSQTLHDQAERCRRLARATYDRATSKVLGDMAQGFDKTAEELDGKTPQKPL